MGRPKKDSEQERIVKKINAMIQEGQSHCTDKHIRIEENFRYVRGQQWREGDLLKQALRDRPAVPFNSVFKIVNAIANREIIDRFSPKVYGRSDDDKAIAEVLDMACKWQRDQSETEHSESSAVASMVTSGYGCMHKYWDSAANNGDGKIVDEDIPMWQMLWPARARQANMADRRWHLCGKWVPKADLEAQFGDSSREAKKFFSSYKRSTVLVDETTNSLDNQGSRRFGAMSWSDIRPNKWISLAEDEVFVVEAEWIETDWVFKVAVPDALFDLRDFINGDINQIQVGMDQMQQPMMLTRDQFAQLPADQKVQLISQILQPNTENTFETQEELDQVIETYLAVTGEEFSDYRRAARHNVKYAIMTDQTVWEYGDRKYGFSYEFMTGWRLETRDGIDFFGVVDIAKGPQDYKNALLSNALAMYMASPKNPLIIESDATADIEKFSNQFSSPSGLVVASPGFLSSGKFLQLQAPSFPPMLPELLKLTDNAVDSSFGLSTMDLGTQGDLRRVSGTVVQAAKTSGNTIVAVLFDSIRRFRKRFGILNVKFIQEMYPPEEIARIVGAEKQDDLQIVHGDDWGDINRYDILIDEEPVSKTERLEMMDYMTRTGSLDNWLNQKFIEFPDLLEILPQIPESWKRKIMAKAQQRDAQNQQIQQMQQNISLLQAQAGMWNQLLDTIPEGATVRQQYEALLAIKSAADQQAQVDQQNQQQQQEGQQVADQTQQYQQQ